MNIVFENIRSALYRYKSFLRIVCTLICVGVFLLMLSGLGGGGYICLAAFIPFLLIIFCLVRDLYLRNICMFTVIVIILRFLFA